MRTEDAIWNELESNKDPLLSRHCSLEGSCADAALGGLFRLALCEARLSLQMSSCLLHSVRSAQNTVATDTYPLRSLLKKKEKKVQENIFKIYFYFFPPFYNFYGFLHDWYLSALFSLCSSHLFEVGGLQLEKSDVWNNNNLDFDIFELRICNGCFFLLTFKDSCPSHVIKPHPHCPDEADGLICIIKLKKIKYYLFYIIFNLVLAPASLFLICWQWI